MGHGSPMNAIEENEFVAGFRKTAIDLPVPSAILCVSAHWETRGTFVTAMESPRTIHDDDFGENWLKRGGFHYLSLLIFLIQPNFLYMFNHRTLFHPFAILGLIALAVYGLSCTTEASANEDPNVKKASLNPNGDSELALLMRAMYDDAVQMKAAIERGEQPTPAIDHGEMLTAEATEPEKAASSTYQVWAQSYLQTIQSLKNEDPALVPERYNDMVNTCMACHSDLCPGPKMKIQHLY